MYGRAPHPSFSYPKADLEFTRTLQVTLKYNYADQLLALQMQIRRLA